MNAQDWPFVAASLLTVVVVVGLLPANRAAFDAFRRPGPVFDDGPARRRGRFAWLLSITAVFAGPLAAAVALISLVIAWRAGGLGEPSDRKRCARVAAVNSIAVVAVSVAFVAAVWWASG